MTTWRPTLLDEVVKIDTIIGSWAEIVTHGELQELPDSNLETSFCEWTTSLDPPPEAKTDPSCAIEAKTKTESSETACSDTVGADTYDVQGPTCDGANSVDYTTDQITVRRWSLLRAGRRGALRGPELTRLVVG